MDPKYLMMMEEQIALEEEQQAQGVADFRKRNARAAELGRESTTAHGKRMMGAMHAPCAEAITEWINNAGGNRGRPSAALKYLERFDADLLAALTLQTVLDGIATGNYYSTLATRLGTSLETEQRLGRFERERKGLYLHILKDLTKRGAGDAWKRTVLLHSKGKHGIEDDKWPLVDKLHVGKVLIDLCMMATNAFERQDVRTGPRHSDRKVQLRLKDHMIDACKALNERMEVMSPAWMPTIVPPRRWTNPRAGGYWYSERLQLVKDNRWQYMEELMARVDEMQAVYSAINAVQDTAWTVNAPVLQVMRDLWFAGGGIAGLPPAEDLALPSTAPIVEGDKNTLIAWKRAAAKIHERNAKLMSKRLLFIRTLSMAERFSKYERIWFPMQFDFRGRMYAVPKFLQPQGDDVAKSLLTFADAKPINDEIAAGWLAVHGANQYGVDKVSFDARIAWVEEHSVEIEICAADPMNSKWWMDADKPWQFLAWCVEWAAFQAHGYGYESRLPVALDGSCNGLQHFSAMLRDRVGGAATNLLPAAEPKDIYQEVADVVEQKLKVCANDTIASKWLTVGINRKTVKRPVMVLPYGGTAYSCRGYLEEWLREQKQDVIADDEVFEATRYLADIVWASIGEVVVAARDAMGWLQKAARVAGKEGLPLQWDTPDGFPVLQAYQKFNKKRVKTKMGGTLMYIQLRESTNQLDTKRQSNGASPNFVHSMDATAMRMYTNIARDNGISNFGLVHDSFATHAADTEMSAACIRHAFVDLYAGEDVLETLRTSLSELVDDPDDIPPVPTKGSLEIESIHGADYFFA